jgi:NCS2 family nucleobase:cation symporter-2
VPTIYAKFPDWFQTVMNSGISAGCVTAIALNLLFNHLPSQAVSASKPVPLAPAGVERPAGQEAV